MVRPRTTVAEPTNDARRLYETGWTVQALADLTGVRPRTVEGWLTHADPANPNPSAAKLLALALAEQGEKP